MKNPYLTDVLLIITATFLVLAGIAIGFTACSESPASIVNDNPKHVIVARSKLFPGDAGMDAGVDSGFSVIIFDNEE